MSGNRGKATLLHPIIRDKNEPIDFTTPDYKNLLQSQNAEEKLNSSVAQEISSDHDHTTQKTVEEELELKKTKVLIKTKNFKSNLEQIQNNVTEATNNAKTPKTNEKLISDVTCNQTSAEKQEDSPLTFTAETKKEKNVKEVKPRRNIQIEEASRELCIQSDAKKQKEKIMDEGLKNFTLCSTYIKETTKNELQIAKKLQKLDGQVELAKPAKVETSNAIMTPGNTVIAKVHDERQEQSGKVGETSYSSSQQEREQSNKASLYETEEMQNRMRASKAVPHESVESNKKIKYSETSLSKIEGAKSDKPNEIFTSTNAESSEIITIGVNNQHHAAEEKEATNEVKSTPPFAPQKQTAADILTQEANSQVSTRDIANISKQHSTRPEAASKHLLNTAGNMSKQKDCAELIESTPSSKSISNRRNEVAKEVIREQEDLERSAKSIPSLPIQKNKNNTSETFEKPKKATQVLHNLRTPEHMQDQLMNTSNNATKKVHFTHKKNTITEPEPNIAGQREKNIQVGGEDKHPAKQPKKAQISSNLGENENSLVVAGLTESRSTNKEVNYVTGIITERNQEKLNASPQIIEKNKTGTNFATNISERKKQGRPNAKNADQNSTFLTDERINGTKKVLEPEAKTEETEEPPDFNKLQSVNSAPNISNKAEIFNETETVDDKEVKSVPKGSTLKLDEVTKTKTQISKHKLELEKQSLEEDMDGKVNLTPELTKIKQSKLLDAKKRDKTVEPIEPATVIASFDLHNHMECDYAICINEKEDSAAKKIKIVDKMGNLALTSVEEYSKHVRKVKRATDVQLLQRTTKKSLSKEETISTQHEAGKPNRSTNIEELLDATNTPNAPEQLTSETIESRTKDNLVKTTKDAELALPSNEEPFSPSTLKGLLKEKSSEFPHPVKEHQLKPDADELLTIPRHPTKVEKSNEALKTEEQHVTKDLHTSGNTENDTAEDTVKQKMNTSGAAKNTSASQKQIGSTIVLNKSVQKEQRDVILKHSQQQHVLSVAKQLSAAGKTMKISNNKEKLNEVVSAERSSRQEKTETAPINPTLEDETGMVISLHKPFGEEQKYEVAKDVNRQNATLIKKSSCTGKKSSVHEESEESGETVMTLELLNTMASSNERGRVKNSIVGGEEQRSVEKRINPSQSCSPHKEETNAVIGFRKPEPKEDEVVKDFKQQNLLFITKKVLISLEMKFLEGTGKLDKSVKSDAERNTAGNKTKVKTEKGPKAFTPVPERKQERFAADALNEATQEWQEDEALKDTEQQQAVLFAKNTLNETKEKRVLNFETSYRTDESLQVHKPQETTAVIALNKLLQEETGNVIRGAEQERLPFIQKQELLHREAIIPASFPGPHQALKKQDLSNAAENLHIKEGTRSNDANGTTKPRVRKTGKFDPVASKLEKETVTLIVLDKPVHEERDEVVISAKQQNVLSIAEKLPVTQKRIKVLKDVVKSNRALKFETLLNATNGPCVIVLEKDVADTEIQWMTKEPRRIGFSTSSPRNEITMTVLLNKPLWEEGDEVIKGKEHQEATLTVKFPNGQVEKSRITIESADAISHELDGIRSDTTYKKRKEPKTRLPPTFPLMMNTTYVTAGNKTLPKTEQGDFTGNEIQELAPVNIKRSPMNKKSIIFNEERSDEPCEKLGLTAANLQTLKTVDDSRVEGGTAEEPQKTVIPTSPVPTVNEESAVVVILNKPTRTEERCKLMQVFLRQQVIFIVKKQPSKNKGARTVEINKATETEVKQNESENLRTLKNKKSRTTNCTEETLKKTGNASLSISIPKKEIFAVIALNKVIQKGRNDKVIREVEKKQLLFTVERLPSEQKNATVFSRKEKLEEPGTIKEPSNVIIKEKIEKTAQVPPPNCNAKEKTAAVIIPSKSLECAKEVGNVQSVGCERAMLTAEKMLSPYKRKKVLNNVGKSHEVLKTEEFKDASGNWHLIREPRKDDVEGKAKEIPLEKGENVFPSTSVMKHGAVFMFSLNKPLQKEKVDDFFKRADWRGAQFTAKKAPPIKKGMEATKDKEKLDEAPNEVKRATAKSRIWSEVVSDGEDGKKAFNELKVPKRPPILSDSSGTTFPLESTDKKTFNTVDESSGQKTASTTAKTVSGQRSGKAEGRDQDVTKAVEKKEKSIEGDGSKVRLQEYNSMKTLEMVKEQETPNKLGRSDRISGSDEPAIITVLCDVSRKRATEYALDFILKYLETRSATEAVEKPINQLEKSNSGAAAVVLEQDQQVEAISENLQQKESSQLIKTQEENLEKADRDLNPAKLHSGRTSKKGKNLASNVPEQKNQENRAEEDVEQSQRNFKSFKPTELEIRKKAKDYDEPPETLKLQNVTFFVEYFKKVDSDCNTEITRIEKNVLTQKLVHSALNRKRDNAKYDISTLEGNEENRSLQDLILEEEKFLGRKERVKTEKKKTLKDPLKLSKLLEDAQVADVEFSCNPLNNNSNETAKKIIEKEITETLTKTIHTLPGQITDATDHSAAVNGSGENEYSENVERFLQNIQRQIFGVQTEENKKVLNTHKQPLESLEKPNAFNVIEVAANKTANNARKGEIAKFRSWRPEITVDLDMKKPEENWHEINMGKVTVHDLKLKSQEVIFVSLNRLTKNDRKQQEVRNDQHNNVQFMALTNQVTKKPTETLDMSEARDKTTNFMESTEVELSFENTGKSCKHCVTDKVVSAERRKLAHSVPSENKRVEEIYVCLTVIRKEKEQRFRVLEEVTLEQAHYTGGIVQKTKKDLTVLPKTTNNDQDFNKVSTADSVQKTTTIEEHNHNFLEQSDDKKEKAEDIAPKPPAKTGEGNEHFDFAERKKVALSSNVLDKKRFEFIVERVNNEKKEEFSRRIIPPAFIPERDSNCELKIQKLEKNEEFSRTFADFTCVSVRHYVKSLQIKNKPQSVLNKLGEKEGPVSFSGLKNAFFFPGIVKRQEHYLDSSNIINGETMEAGGMTFLVVNRTGEKEGTLQVIQKMEYEQTWYTIKTKQKLKMDADAFTMTANPYKFPKPVKLRDIVLSPDVSTGKDEDYPKVAAREYKQAEVVKGSTLGEEIQKRECTIDTRFHRKQEKEIVEVTQKTTNDFVAVLVRKKVRDVRKSKNLEKVGNLISLNDPRKTEWVSLLHNISGAKDDEFITVPAFSKKKERISDDISLYKKGEKERATEIVDYFPEEFLQFGIRAGKKINWPMRTREKIGRIIKSQRSRDPIDESYTLNLSRNGAEDSATAVNQSKKCLDSVEKTVAPLSKNTVGRNVCFIPHTCEKPKEMTLIEKKTPCQQTKRTNIAVDLRIHKPRQEEQHIKIMRGVKQDSAKIPITATYSLRKKKKITQKSSELEKSSCFEVLAPSCEIPNNVEVASPCDSVGKDIGETLWKISSPSLLEKGKVSVDVAIQRITQKGEELKVLAEAVHICVRYPAKTTKSIRKDTKAIGILGKRKQTKALMKATEIIFSTGLPTDFERSSVKNKRNLALCSDMTPYLKAYEVYSVIIEKKREEKARATQIIILANYKPQYSYTKVILALCNPLQTSNTPSKHDNAIKLESRTEVTSSHKILRGSSHLTVTVLKVTAKLECAKKLIPCIQVKKKENEDFYHCEAEYDHKEEVLYKSIDLNRFQRKQVGDTTFEVGSPVTVVENEKSGRPMELGIFQDDMNKRGEDFVVIRNEEILEKRIGKPTLSILTENDENDNIPQNEVKEKRNRKVKNEEMVAEIFVGIEVLQEESTKAIGVIKMFPVNHKPEVVINLNEITVEPQLVINRNTTSDTAVFLNENQKKTDWEIVSTVPLFKMKFAEDSEAGKTQTTDSKIPEPPAQLTNKAACPKISATDDFKNAAVKRQIEGRVSEEIPLITAELDEDLLETYINKAAEEMQAVKSTSIMAFESVHYTCIAKKVPFVTVVKELELKSNNKSFPSKNFTTKEKLMIESELRELERKIISQKTVPLFALQKRITDDDFGVHKTTKIKEIVILGEELQKQENEEKGKYSTNKVVSFMLSIDVKIAQFHKLVKTIADLCKNIFNERCS